MEIKRIGINDATPGMLVAENVYNTVNQLIVPKDAVLTDKAIARMRFHSILSLRIFESDEIEMPIFPAKLPAGDKERSYFEKLRETEEFAAYSKAFEGTTTLVENELKKLMTGQDADTSAMVDIVRKMHNSCRSGIQQFDLLHSMRNYDDTTFAHSLNVALICAVEGSWLGMSDADIDLLIQCGLYHDVGKLMIPKDILNKPTPLTPEEFKTVKSHAMQGYNMLHDRHLDTRVKMVAMMHHERCDGSGYPLGIKGDQIEAFAKILMIADIYEAMTSPRSYRQAKCPFDVIKIFETDGLSQYDPRYLLTFMENITQSYLGTKVRLSDGTVGTIIYINKLAYSRPMIQVSDTQYIDLSKRTDLSISTMI